MGAEAYYNQLPVNLRDTTNATIVTSCMNWISVKDQKPDFEEPVLVFCELYGNYIGVYHFVGEIFGEQHGIWINGTERGVLPPTHWMPLPEPPTK